MAVEPLSAREPVATDTVVTFRRADAERRIRIAGAVDADSVGGTITVVEAKRSTPRRFGESDT